jgi:hypothetical protein
MLTKGNVADLAPLKRAIILETYAELLTILDDYSRRFGSGGKAVKQGMSAVLSDPDVFGRFNAHHQTEIRAIATGSSLFAKSRFDQLHLSMRAPPALTYETPDSSRFGDGISSPGHGPHIAQPSINTLDSLLGSPLGIPIHSGRDVLHILDCCFRYAPDIESGQLHPCSLGQRVQRHGLCGTANDRPGDRVSWEHKADRCGGTP